MWRWRDLNPRQEIKYAILYRLSPVMLRLRRKPDETRKIFSSFCRPASKICGAEPDNNISIFPSSVKREMVPTLR